MAIIFGTSGSNTINGTNGSDIILAGAGNDIVNGGSGSDLIDGGAGNDTLNGGAGSDIILAGSGDDTVDGGADSDIIYGDDGNDRLTGGSGDDIIFGGAGNDFFYHNVTENIDSNNLTFDYYDGNAGSDTLVLYLTDLQLADLIASGALAAWNASNKSSVFNFRQYVSYIDLQIVNIENIVIVTPNRAPDAQDDNVLALKTDAPLTGNVLTNDTDPDGPTKFVVNTAQNIHLQYGTLTVLANGSYTYTIDQANAAVQALQFGSTLQDTYSYTVSDGAGGTDVAILKITINGVEAGLPVIRGSDAAENITATNASEAIYLGAGNDAVSALGGDDKIFAGDGNDVVDGGAGNDVIFGGNGADAIFGGDGNDRINTGKNATLIEYGGLTSAQEAIINDVFSVAPLGDFIDGGAGTADTAVFNKALSSYSFTYYDTPLGRSVISLADLDPNAATNEGHDAILGNGSGASSVEYMEFNGELFKLVSGTNAGNELSNTVESDLVLGFNGNDTINTQLNLTQSGHDFYDGGAGNDTLNIALTALQHNLFQSAWNQFIASNKSQVFDFSSVIAGMNVRVQNIENLAFTTVANSQASITAPSGGQVFEDGIAIAQGQASIFDGDLGEQQFQVVSNGASQLGYGTFSIDAAGAWTYTLNNGSVQFLKATDTLTDHFTIASLDGSASQVIDVTIRGADDNAVIDFVNSNPEGTVKEDVTLSTGGKVTVIDPDQGQNGFQTLTNAFGANGYGRFSIDEAGNWTYVLDNSNGEVQALREGDSLTDFRLVRSLDGTSQLTLIAHVVGTNDGASISGQATGAVTEDTDVDADGNLVASGQLVAEDVDHDEAAFQVPASLAGTYGNFTFDAEVGQWTYAVNNALSSVQTLKAGDQIHDYLTVQSFDGTATQVIDVTIRGSNDAAVIDFMNSNQAGTVKEDVTLSTGGKVTVIDPDQGQNGFQTLTNAFGANGYGRFSIDAAGNWTYVLDNNNGEVQALREGDSLTDFRLARSLDGTAQLTLIANIIGTNDAPIVISPIANVQINENTAIAIDTSLVFSDIDNGDVLTYSATLANGFDLSTIGLAIDSATGLITGTSHFVTADENYVINVTATDANGLSSPTQSFTLTVKNDPFLFDHSVASLTNRSLSGNPFPPLKIINMGDTSLSHLAQDISFFVNGSGGASTYLFSFNDGIVYGQGIFLLNALNINTVQFQLDGANDGIDATYNVILGTFSSDGLNGTNGDDLMYGFLGDDSFASSNGNNYMNGGDGIDSVSYAAASTSVMVDLLAGSATVGANHDILASIENAAGSQFADVIKGDVQNNSFTGNGGADTFVIGWTPFNNTELLGNDSITDFNRSQGDKLQFVTPAGNGDANLTNLLALTDVVNNAGKIRIEMYSDFYHSQLNGTIDVTGVTFVSGKTSILDYLHLGTLNVNVTTADGLGLTTLDLSNNYGNGGNAVGFSAGASGLGSVAAVAGTTDLVGFDGGNGGNGGNGNSFSGAGGNGGNGRYVIDGSTSTQGLTIWGGDGGNGANGGNGGSANYPFAGQNGGNAGSGSYVINGSAFDDIIHVGTGGNNGTAGIRGLNDSGPFGGSAQGGQAGFAGVGNYSVNAGGGNDTIHFGTNTDFTVGMHINGGAGVDTFVIDTIIGPIDLSGNHLTNIEHVNMGLDFYNTLQVSIQDVLNINSNHELFIDGGSTHAVYLSSTEWSGVTSTVADYQQFTSSDGAATLYVMSSIGVGII